MPTRYDAAAARHEFGSVIANYSFYRSILICTIQILHNTGNTGCSGASIIPSLFFSLWTIITLPVAFSLALDKDGAVCNGM